VGYGAGESIWMYLMFEALGQVSDRELMLVNLDLLDAAHMREFPPRKLNFILFNPTPMARPAKMTIPPAKERAVHLTVNNATSGTTLQIPAKSFIRIVAEY